MSKLRKERIARIIEALKVEGALTTTQVTRICALSRGEAWRLLSRLEADGIVLSVLTKSTRTKQTAHVKREWILRLDRQGDPT